MCFISGHGWYTSGGQKARGSFLMVFQPPRGDPTSKLMRPPLRVLLRYVTMEQLGHFMMADVIVKLPDFENDRCRIVLSGDYGSDGLPIMPDDRPAKHDPYRELPFRPAEMLWPYLHPLPEDLQKAFWDGGGHNEGGSEKPLIRAWARKHSDELRRLREPDHPEFPYPDLPDGFTPRMFFRLWQINIHYGRGEIRGVKFDPTTGDGITLVELPHVGMESPRFRVREGCITFRKHRSYYDRLLSLGRPSRV